MDYRKCSGCRICELVCAVEHFSVNNPKKAAIRVRSSFPNPMVNKPSYCRQCRVPKCMLKCSELSFNAIHRSKDGVIRVNPRKCTGCKACAKACPFGVPFFHEDLKYPILCDLCRGDPECVKWCPLGVLRFVTSPMAYANNRFDLAKKLSGGA